MKVYDVDSDQFIPLREMLLRLLNDRNVSVVGSAMVAFHQLCVAKPPSGEEEATYGWLSVNLLKGALAGGAAPRPSVGWLARPRGRRRLSQ